MRSMRRIVLPITISALWLVAAAAIAAQPKVDPLSVANLWQPGDPGERLYIRGRVVSTDGTPLQGATVNIRQADGTGQYQAERYRGAVRTADDGSYQLNTVLPGQESGTRHIHLTVTHEFHAQVTTEILFKADPLLDPTAERDAAIPLETAQAQGAPILFGNFEVVMQPMGGN